MVLSSCRSRAGRVTVFGVSLRNPDARSARRPRRPDRWPGCLAHSGGDDRRPPADPRNRPHDLPALDLGQHHDLILVDHAEIGRFAGLVTQPAQERQGRGDEIAVADEGRADRESLAADVPEAMRLVELDEAPALQRRQQAMDGGQRKACSCREALRRCPSSSSASASISVNALSTDCTRPCRRSSAPCPEPAFARSSPLLGPGPSTASRSAAATAASRDLQLAAPSGMGGKPSMVCGIFFHDVETARVPP